MSGQGFKEYAYKRQPIKSNLHAVMVVCVGVLFGMYVVCHYCFLWWENVISDFKIRYSSTMWSSEIPIYSALVIPPGVVLIGARIIAFVQPMIEQIAKIS